MKFLNDKGEVVEGTVLTDEQVNKREQIMRFAHETICGGYARHSDYERRTSGSPKCELLANFFITKFELNPLATTDFEGEIAEAESTNAPQAIEEPQPPAPAETIPSADAS